MSVSPSEIEALLFDVFGTLTDWRRSVAGELAAFFTPHGLLSDWNEVAGAWRALYQPALEEVRAGRRPFVRLDVLHAENLARVLERYGLDGVLEEDALQELNRAWHRLAPWPDVTDGLARLKRRFILAPCSNGDVAMMVRLARHSGLPWDTVLGSEMAQAYKPAPSVYRRSAELLDLPPGRCLFVAAHHDDLAAARREGMATAFIPRPHEHEVPGDASRSGDDWDVVATDVADLADRLGC